MSIPQIYLQDFVGKSVIIHTVDDVQFGKLLSEQDGWIKLEQRKGFAIVRVDMITTLSEVPEKKPKK